MHYTGKEGLYQRVEDTLGDCRDRSARNLAWLQAQMDPYFSITMQEEVASIANLAAGLQGLAENQRLILADREKTLILARLNLPGSLYDTLQTIQEKEISYAQFTHSYEPVPGLSHELEVQRFDFDRKEHQEINRATGVTIPAGIKTGIADALQHHYPQFDHSDLDRLLRLLWLNNEWYVRISPPKRVAQILWLYQQGNRQGGIYLDVEQADAPEQRQESRVMFAVGNPPQKDFLVQIMEVFNRLNLGVKRAYCLTISNGVHPYFLGTFYVHNRAGGDLTKGSGLFDRLQQELYNTQILSTASHTYREFVTRRLMSGEEGSLVNAFISFCHTNLAHHHPDPFGYEDVMRAFHSHPDIALQLTKLFRTRFEPGIGARRPWRRPTWASRSAPAPTWPWNRRASSSCATSNSSACASIISCRSMARRRWPTCRPRVAWSGSARSPAPSTCSRAARSCKSG